jgi:hypothetical protein
MQFPKGDDGIADQSAKADFMLAGCEIFHEAETNK